MAGDAVAREDRWSAAPELDAPPLPLPRFRSETLTQAAPQWRRVPPILDMGPVLQAMIENFTAAMAAAPAARPEGPRRLEGQEG